jgi:hypothetical protein
MRLSTLAVLVTTVFAAAARAEIFGGVDFPDGASSFVDAVFSYDPVIRNGEPTVPFRSASNAIGVPDFGSVNDENAVVSLGDGGSITLQFTDNALTGSGSDLLDLWIFEVGSDIEDMFVEVSANGGIWFSVGKVGGATAGVDLDAFGFGTADHLFFVRLTDDPDADDQTGPSVGADIDAVGAITSVVPEPPAMIFVATGFLAISALKRRAAPSSLRRG